ncbi:MAG: STAS domain-containing protein [Candidatus Brocadiae bacterium]|nr:STAS domain-containing protein [Candidatus Brocadiia bacterium]
MVESNGRFCMATYEKNILIRVEGLATKNNTYLFQNFVEKMLQENFKHFIIDFSMCKGMDSTFMGVLLQISNTVELKLLHVGVVCKKSLDSLGISRFFNIIKEKKDLENFCYQILEGGECSKEKMVVMIHDAHTALIKANPENKELFEAFLSDLSSEIKKYSKT